MWPGVSHTAAILVAATAEPQVPLRLSVKEWATTWHPRSPTSNKIISLRNSTADGRRKVHFIDLLQLLLELDDRMLELLQPRGRWITTNFTTQTHTIPKSSTFSIKALFYADSSRLWQTLCRWVGKTRSSSPDDTDPYPRRMVGVFIHTTIQSRISRRDALEPQHNFREYLRIQACLVT
jgi:hypothetical protein